MEGGEAGCSSLEKEEPSVSEVHSVYSPVSVSPNLLSLSNSEHNSSYGSESDSRIQSPVSAALYFRIEIPTEPTLPELLQASTDEDLLTVTQVKLQVISSEISLQHLSFYTPQLTELILDGSVILSLRDLGCNLNNLKILRVCRCNLTSLDGLSGLRTLEELHAEKNLIQDIIPCINLHLIKHLNLKCNKLSKIDSVGFLTLCSNLQHLELDGNYEIYNLKDYRIVIKRLLPDLKSLDGKCLDDVDHLIPSPSNEDIEVPSTSSSPRPTSSRRVNKIEGMFTVKFTPKVVSPRPMSSDSDSTSSFTSEVTSNSAQTLEERENE